jgi:hypothetical protein
MRFHEVCEKFRRLFPAINAIRQTKLGTSDEPPSARCTRMTPKTRLSIRIDSVDGKIGAKQIAFLEAIQSQGSITGAGRFTGLSYRGARLMIDAINKALCEPAVIGERSRSFDTDRVVPAPGDYVSRPKHGRGFGSAEGQRLRKPCSSTMKIGCPHAGCHSPASQLGLGSTAVGAIFYSGHRLPRPRPY